MRMKYPVMKVSPIATSQIASKGMDKAWVTSPNVILSMVSVAISSAELTPGKNFRTPYQKKTIPMLILSSVIPFFAIHSYAFFSYNSNFSIIFIIDSL